MTWLDDAIQERDARRAWASHEAESYTGAVFDNLIEVACRIAGATVPVGPEIDMSDNGLRYDLRWSVRSVEDDKRVVADATICIYFQSEFGGSSTRTVSCGLYERHPKAAFGRIWAHGTKHFDGNQDLAGALRRALAEAFLGLRSKERRLQ